MNINLKAKNYLNLSIITILIIVLFVSFYAASKVQAGNNELTYGTGYDATYKTWIKLELSLAETTNYNFVIFKRTNPGGWETDFIPFSSQTNGFFHFEAQDNFLLGGTKYKYEAIPCLQNKMSSCAFDSILTVEPMTNSPIPQKSEAMIWTEHAKIGSNGATNINWIVKNDANNKIDRVLIKLINDSNITLQEQSYPKLMGSTYFDPSSSPFTLPSNIGNYQFEICGYNQNEPSNCLAIGKQDFKITNDIYIPTPSGFEANLLSGTIPNNYYSAHTWDEIVSLPGLNNAVPNYVFSHYRLESYRIDDQGRDSSELFWNQFDATDTSDYYAFIDIIDCPTYQVPFNFETNFNDYLNNNNSDQKQNRCFIDQIQSDSNINGTYLMRIRYILVNSNDSTKFIAGPPSQGQQVDIHYLPTPELITSEFNYSSETSNQATHSSSWNISYDEPNDIGGYRLEWLTPEDYTDPQNLDWGNCDQNLKSKWPLSTENWDCNFIDTIDPNDINFETAPFTVTENNEGQWFYRLKSIDNPELGKYNTSEPSSIVETEMIYNDNPKANYIKLMEVIKEGDYNNRQYVNQTLVNKEYNFAFNKDYIYHFQAEYEDDQGATDLKELFVLFNSIADLDNTCSFSLRYDTTNHSFYHQTNLSYPDQYQNISLAQSLNNLDRLSANLTPTKYSSICNQFIGGNHSINGNKSILDFYIKFSGIGTDREIANGEESGLWNEASNVYAYAFDKKSAFSEYPVPSLGNIQIDSLAPNITPTFKHTYQKGNNHFINATSDTAQITVKGQDNGAINQVGTVGLKLINQKVPNETYEIFYDFTDNTEQPSISISPENALDLQLESADPNTNSATFNIYSRNNQNFKSQLILYAEDAANYDFNLSGSRNNITNNIFIIDANGPKISLNSNHNDYTNASTIQIEGTLLETLGFDSGVSKLEYKIINDGNNLDYTEVTGQTFPDFNFSITNLSAEHPSLFLKAYDNVSNTTEHEIILNLDYQKPYIDFIFPNDSGILTTDNQTILARLKDNINTNQIGTFPDHSFANIDNNSIQLFDQSNNQININITTLEEEKTSAFITKTIEINPAEILTMGNNYKLVFNDSPLIKDQVNNFLDPYQITFFTVSNPQLLRIQKQAFSLEGNPISEINTNESILYRLTIYPDPSENLKSNRDLSINPLEVSDLLPPYFNYNSSVRSTYSIYDNQNNIILEEIISPIESNHSSEGQLLNFTIQTGTIPYNGYLVLKYTADIHSVNIN